MPLPCYAYLKRRFKSHEFREGPVRCSLREAEGVRVVRVRRARNVCNENGDPEKEEGELCGMRADARGRSTVSSRAKSVGCLSHRNITPNERVLGGGTLASRATGQIIRRRQFSSRYRLPLQRTALRMPRPKKDSNALSFWLQPSDRENGTVGGRKRSSILLSGFPTG
jgi:hypothetical protein